MCGAAHTGLVRGLGADRVIDRDEVDFTKDGHQYDVIFDAVGKSSIGGCRPLLKPRGLYLTTDLGPWSQNTLLPVVTRLAHGRRVMLPTPIETQEVIEYLRERIASGRFRPVVDRGTRSGSVEAYRYVETGQRSGTSSSLWCRHVSALTAHGRRPCSRSRGAIVTAPADPDVSPLATGDSRPSAAANHWPPAPAGPVLLDASHSDLPVAEIRKEFGAPGDQSITQALRAYNARYTGDHRYFSIRYAEMITVYQPI